MLKLLNYFTIFIHFYSILFEHYIPSSEPLVTGLGHGET